MGKSKTIEILKDLASDMDSRSESARMAEIFHHIENALKAGVKRQAVLNVLHDEYGFKMTMSGFEKALKKLRNNKKTCTESNCKQKIIDQDNTDSVEIPLVIEKMNKYFDSSNEENKKNDEAHPKNEQLVFMENLRKPPDIAELLEIDRSKKQEQREKNRMEKEKVIRSK